MTRNDYRWGIIAPPEKVADPDRRPKPDYISNLISLKLKMHSLLTNKEYRSSLSTALTSANNYLPKFQYQDSKVRTFILTEGKK